MRIKALTRTVGVGTSQRVALRPDAELQTSGLTTLVEYAQLMPAAVEGMVEGCVQRGVTQRSAIEEPPAPATSPQRRKAEPQ